MRYTIFALLIFGLGCGQEGVVTGDQRQWAPLTVSFEGPETAEDATPNPFLDYRLTVTFTHSGSGESFVVPGYFAADGNAAETSAKEGKIWQARFTPPSPGEWSYKASFRTGQGIALSDDAMAGEAGAIDGASGTLSIAVADQTTDGFYSKGFLRAIGGRYFQFSDGSYFLKGGADSPENFLGYYEFDDTYDSGKHEAIDTDADKFIHKYEPHAGDWKTGDPTWQGGKGKNIIGALNYLASEEMNSVYFLTYNVDGGDGKDTWMWTSPEERERFDVSKLAQWEIVFEHMDRLGLMLHVITHETENDEELGGDGGLNDIRKLYFRELVARFAHHPAIVWNLGEENDMTDADRLDNANYIRNLDPYDHPLTVHTHNKKALTFYDGLLGKAPFDATSIQGLMEEANAEAIELIRRSAEAGRPWAIFHDEQTPAGVGAMPDKDDPDHDLPRKGELWGNLMAGGSGVEWYFGYQYDHMDLSAEDWRSRDILWDQTRYALEFFHQHLPFWEMSADNELASAEGAYVLAKPGEVYAVFLPDRGSTELTLAEGGYTVAWYDPRGGGALQVGTVETVDGPGAVSLGAPPADADKDWAVLVKKR
jgi:hypothetical protein